MVENEYRRRLVEYLKKNLSKGYTADTLRWALIKQGNSRSVVELALDVAQKELAESVPKFNEEPKVEYEPADTEIEVTMPKKPWWRKLFGG